MKKEKGKGRRGSIKSRNEQNTTDSAVRSRPALRGLQPGRRQLVISAGLIVATLAVYGQVVAHQFINLDDDIYIYENPMVTAGWTVKGLTWAFTTFHAANWHPLTWLSHMLDAQMFGLT